MANCPAKESTPLRITIDKFVEARDYKVCSWGSLTLGRIIVIFLAFIRTAKAVGEIASTAPQERTENIFLVKGLSICKYLDRKVNNCGTCNEVYSL